MRPLPTARADAPAHYSTNIADAWQVVEKHPGIYIMQSDTGKWAATWDGTGQAQDGKHDPEFWTAMFESEDWTETALRAICLAALKAVGVEV